MLDDEQAWHDVFQHYKLFVYSILHDMNISPNDIDDITQQVMLKISNDYKTYDRAKGPFRYWFSRVIKNQALMYIRKQKTLKESVNIVGEEIDISELFSQESEIEVKIRRSYEAFLIKIGLENTSKHFNGQAMKIFMMDQEGESIDKIMEVTGLTKNSIYVLRSRVKRTFRLEMERLYELYE